MIFFKIREKNLHYFILKFALKSRFFIKHRKFLLNMFYIYYFNQEIKLTYFLVFLQTIELKFTTQFRFDQ